MSYGRMKYLAAVLAVFSITACRQDRADHPLVHADDTVLLEVDDRPVTLPMLESLMETRGVAEDDQARMRALLDELVRLSAVAEHARREGLSRSKDVRAERMLKDIEVQYAHWLRKFQRENPVTEAEIEDVYRRQLERAGDTQYQIEAIEFSDQAAALAVQAGLMRGALSFEQAIAQASAEGRVARRTDWIDLSQMPRDFGELLKATGDGAVVDGVMPYQDLWLVVRRADSRPFEPPALDEVRDGIRAELLRRKTESMIQQIYERAEIVPIMPLEPRQQSAD